MSGINQHTILGNVGKIETRYTPGGKAIVNMSIATSEKWKDKNTGQAQEKTDWHNVVVFGKPAEIIGDYVNKGDKIYIQGKVVTRKWQDNEGKDRYSTETVVDGFNGKFELLGGKGDKQAPQQGEYKIDNPTYEKAPQQNSAIPPQQSNYNQSGQAPQTGGGVATSGGAPNADNFEDIPFLQHERFLL